MMTAQVFGHRPFAMQSIISYEAPQTRADKIRDVVEKCLLPAAGIALSLLVTGLAYTLPPVIRYACYGVVGWAMRQIFARLIGHAVYPATFIFKKAELQKQYDDSCDYLQATGYRVQEVALIFGNHKYSAYLIGHKDEFDNKKWSVHLPPNAVNVESQMVNLAHQNYQNFKCNTLLINGPGVGKQEGYPIRRHMGKVVDLALQYLEKEVKATHISLSGWSLGGGMVAEGVLTHKFSQDKTKYLGIFDRTFNRLSDEGPLYVELIVSDLLPRIIVHHFGAYNYSSLIHRVCAVIATLLKGITYLALPLTGTELDCTSGAKKLDAMGIKQIVIQHEHPHIISDGIIFDAAALSKDLKQGHSLQHTVYLTSPNMDHNSRLPNDIEDELTRQTLEFFNS